VSVLRSVWRVIVPPLIVGGLFVATWELIVRIFDIQPFLLPSPSAIWSALVENIDKVWDAMVVTGANAMVGLVFGVICGVALSFVLMRFNVLNELVTPLAVALNAIPIIVLVPVFNNMFSSTTEIPRRLMVTLVVSFIVLVNVAKGLRQVSPIHMELMHSYAASKSDILRKTRIPNAVSYLFTALKIAAPVAVITAFVAEYFGGSQNGLGYGITSNAAVSRTAASWAYVIGACALGLAFYGAAVLLERVASPARRPASPPSSRRRSPSQPSPSRTSQSQPQQHTGGLAPGGAT
jgi:NitT/TauT family transport system permease protein